MRVPRSRSFTMSMRSGRWLGAALALMVVASCQSIPEGVGGDKLGSVHVTVLDQNNVPVTNANVVVQENSGATIIQKQSGTSTTGGVIDFEGVNQATLQAWADPPDGYSGGGQANATTFTIVAGGNVNVTVLLTKNP